MKSIINNIKVQGAYATADRTNKEGAPAWSQSNDESVSRIMMTGTLSRAFYASQREVVQEALAVIKQSARSNPKHLSVECVRGRQDGFIRSAPIMGLVALSETSPDLFKDIFTSVIKTGNDLEDFIGMVRAFGRGFGRSIKTAIHGWLKQNATEFYAMKYTKQLGYAVRLSRPKFSDPIKNAVIDYVMHFVHQEKESDVNKFAKALCVCPQLDAYEQAKIAYLNDDLDKVCRLIEQNRLDPSALLGLGKPSHEMWYALSKQMGTMMYLKYLSKMCREGVITPEILHSKINVKALEKAKVFPFRLYIAYENIPTDQTGMMVRDYLAKVLNDYVTTYDWSKWDRKIVIAPDVSSSMTCQVEGSKMTPATIAGMFSGLLYKGVPNSVLLPWDEIVQLKLVKPRLDSVLSHIDSIKNAEGGGTYMYKPVEYMLLNNIECDVFIGITDSEEWNSSGWRRSGWLATWIQYKKIYPNAKAVLIRVANYNTNPFSEEDAKKYDIYQVYGWTDSVLSYIENTVLV